MKVIFLGTLVVFSFANFTQAADRLTDEELTTALGYHQSELNLTWEQSVAMVINERRSDVAAAQPHNDIDEATAALIEQLQREDIQPRTNVSAARADETHEIDPETLALIQRLQNENQHPAPESASAQNSIFHQVQSHANVQTHRDTLMPLIAHLGSIPQGSDVHVLDTHIAANIGKLPAIGNDFGIDNPNLTNEDISTYLNRFTGTYNGYEGKAVTSAQLQGYITTALTTAASDATTRGLYSRLISIFQRLELEIMPNDFQAHLKHLFDAIAENYMTRGGCFQGVRNRAYIRYISTLNILMGGY